MNALKVQSIDVVTCKLCHNAPSLTCIRNFRCFLILVVFRTYSEWHTYLLTRRAWGAARDLLFCELQNKLLKDAHKRLYPLCTYMYTIPYTAIGLYDDAAEARARRSLCPHDTHTGGRIQPPTRHHMIAVFAYSCRQLKAFGSCDVILIASLYIAEVGGWPPPSPTRRRLHLRSPITYERLIMTDVAIVVVHLSTLIASLASSFLCFVAGSSAVVMQIGFTGISAIQFSCFVIIASKHILIARDFLITVHS